MGGSYFVIGSPQRGLVLDLLHEQDSSLPNLSAWERNGRAVLVPLGLATT
jgi:hypothetical protein